MYQIFKIKYLTINHTTSDSSLSLRTYIKYTDIVLLKNPKNID